MSVVSIDPGDTTGVALWSDDGTFVRKFKLTHEGFVDWCNDFDIEVSKVIVEDFTHARGALNKKGSKMKASQGIGVAAAFARRHSAELIKQKNTVLNIAAMHSGTKLVKHFSDDVSAYLHGYYYFECVGLRKPVLQERDLDR